MVNEADLQSTTVHAAKRKFSRKPLALAAASLMLAVVALPASAGWWNASPSLSIGSTTINVRTKGALGNGVHNDTAAIQAAINALPSSGGTVYVPAGRYMIDASRSVVMRSHTRLQLASNAELDVIPNSLTRYYVVKAWNVNNVEIVGGKMVGDRTRHRGNGGEWGYGINISGSTKVLVKNLHLSNFWGDGMWIGGIGYGSRLVKSTYVTVNNIVSTNNRRQGLSIGPSNYVYIANSTFSNTNGTLPQAGIDIEPLTQGVASNVRMYNIVLSGNRGNGLEMHNNITGIVMTNSTLTGNYGFGALAVSSTGLTMTNNNATKNGLSGIGMSGTSHNVAINSNSLKYNSTRYVSPSKPGGTANRDLQLGGGTWNISHSGNAYTPRR
jgi:hypothetical protein